MKRLILVFIQVLAVVILATFAAANVPNIISFQGVLTDEQGEAVDAAVSMTFSIYGKIDDTEPLWSETQGSVVVSGGLFDILLGSVVPLTDAVFEDSARWLGIAVNGDAELRPRSPMASVPFSYRVATIDSADGGTIKGSVAIAGQLMVGPSNSNAGRDAFVAGNHNAADNDYVTVSGGRYNEARSIYSTISGGFSNQARGDYVTIGGGMGNSAGGLFAFIPGGSKNIADGDYSFVLGNMGIAAHAGSIVMSANDCGT